MSRHVVCGVVAFVGMVGALVGVVMLFPEKTAELSGEHALILLGLVVAVAATVLGLP